MGCQIIFKDKVSFPAFLSLEQECLWMSDSADFAAVVVAPLGPCLVISSWPWWWGALGLHTHSFYLLASRRDLEGALDPPPLFKQWSVCQQPRAKLQTWPRPPCEMFWLLIHHPTHLYRMQLLGVSYAFHGCHSNMMQGADGGQAGVDRKVTRTTD